MCQVLLNFDSVDEIQKFLVDLCTPAEMEALTDRWRVAVMIARGDSYREISKNTGISTATITRVGRYMRTGKGYQIALKRKKSEKNSTHNLVKGGGER